VRLERAKMMKFLADILMMTGSKLLFFGTPVAGLVAYSGREWFKRRCEWIVYPLATFVSGSLLLGAGLALTGRLP
jgi:hypothetical protein